MPRARQFPCQRDDNHTPLLYKHAAARVSAALATHRLYCGAGERGLGTGQVEAPGAEAGSMGSAVAGQGRHAGQRRQQPCVYVNPTEEHGLVQPLIMVMQQHGCAVHGGEAQSWDPHLRGEEEPSGGGRHPAPPTAHPPASSSPRGGSGCQWQRGRSPAPVRGSCREGGKARTEGAQRAEGEWEGEWRGGNALTCPCRPH